MPELWTPSGSRQVQADADVFGALADATGHQDYHALAKTALAKGKQGAVDTSDVVAEMRANRRITKNASGGVNSGQGMGGVGQFSFATARPRDPLFYWRQNNLPYDVAKDEELEKIRAFCNTPDAPVWMADYSFKPMGQIVEGDEVIGWEYRTGPQGEVRKVLVRTPVLAIQRRIAPEIVKVTFESGEVIHCTPDHLWANPHYSPNQTTGWKQPEYRTAEVGRELVRMVTPTPELSSEKELIVAAWLGGVYDGEGCGEGIAQSQSHNPGVCQRIADSLDFLGIPYTQTPESFWLRVPGRRQGAAQDLVDFLNWTNPTRRVTAAIDKRLLATPNGGREKIVSIESEGSGEVVSIQTGTGNYTAWGIASKNCRLLYITHPVIASAIDIFSKYPLIGMEMTGKDDELNDFYGDLFFDQLDYEEFLLDVGREYWTVGEAWPLGTFNDTLGVWESDELINPDDVEVIRSPFLKEPRFKMKLPETIRKIILEREPKWEYEALMRVYPELAHFSREESKMDVSGVLLKQLKFKADSFHPRGIPILMRGFRAVIQEEMLNAAQDAIAERLYTPMIVAKLGASASDLGTTQPWVPNQGDLEAFEASLDAALAGDFRVLIHHFALDISQVFGKEAMPDFSPDFDRLTDRQLQVFGLSRTMLNGAGSGETYAADALNRDIVTQLLSTYQRKIQRFWKSRAMVVAEAQEHYDYEERNGIKYPIMEEILEVNEETGEERIVERPKLLIPDLTFKTMSLADEDSNQQFMETVRASGVPISMKTRLVNVDIDLDEEVEKVKEEQIELAVAAQETRKETYLALLAAGLPIPDDLKEDFQPVAQTQGPVDAAGQPEGPQVLPALGLDEPAPTDALAPTDEDIAAAEDAEADEGEDPNSFGGDSLSGKMPPGDDDQTDDASGSTIPLPRNQHASRPPESDEQRGKMPKGSSLSTGPRHVGARKFRTLDRTQPLADQLRAPVWPHENATKERNETTD